MNIDNEIYFAEGIKSSEIDFDNRHGLINAFYKRIVGYYIQPARMLVESQYAFSAGVIVSALIDAIATYSILKGDNIKELIKDLAFPRGIDAEAIDRFAKEFDDNFRNGLIHEGRIKNGGQFAFRGGALFSYESEFLIIDPRVLLKIVHDYFEQYIEKLLSSDPHYFVFHSKIKRQFEAEILAIKRNKISKS